MRQSLFINFRQIGIGAGCLILGALVYPFARPPGSAFFLPEGLGRTAPLPEFLRPLIGSLPVFAHLVAFSILSVAVFGFGRRGSRIVCLGWGLIHAAFEAGQHPAVRTWLTPRIPAFFDHVWLLRQSRAYFTGGTFDPLDLAAIGLGVAAAYALLLKTERRVQTS